MLTLLVISMLAQTSETRIIRVERVQRVSGRALGGSAPALLEFAPTSGAGMGTECACANVSASTGQSLVMLRGSAAVCTRGSYGLRDTGIANGDLIECAANLPRIERNDSGALGLRVDPSRTNYLLRFIEYTNAAWTTIGTPAPTTGQTSPFSGTFASSAVLVADDDGAAFEGYQQTVTVAAGVAHTQHCLFKAGTATTASVSLDGTVASITGLSASTWSVLEVTDTSSSGTSIVAQARVGNAASVTGSVVFGGCQVEAGVFRTAMIPTTSSAVTRDFEIPTFALVGMSGGDNASMAVSVSGFRGEITYPTPLHLQPAAMGDRGLVSSPPGTGETQARCYAANDATTGFFTSTVALSGQRLWCASQPSGVSGAWGVVMTPGGALSGTFSTLTSASIGISTTAPSLTATRGIYGEVCVNPSFARCR